MKVEASSVAEYIAAFEGEQHAGLIALRTLVMKYLPRAKEELRHGRPFYEGRGVTIAFAVQKNHYSFYLTPTSAIEKNRVLLAGCDLGKGVVRFQHADQLTDAAVKKMLRDAAAEARVGEEERKAKRGNRKGAGAGRARRR
jgi:uncharacterized protein YdhG (YjbR/CyaY superfamily)